MATACTHLWPSYRRAHQSAATQTSRMTGWFTLPYTHICINAPIQILHCTPETVRPFQTYLLQRVVSWCVLLFKCHVPSLASLLWASPWYRGSHPVNMFQVHKHIHKFPWKYVWLFPSFSSCRFSVNLKLKPLFFFSWWLHPFSFPYLLSTIRSLNHSRLCYPSFPILLQREVFSWTSSVT